MVVSKRTRHEVMRRDNFTCRYCRADDQPLTIDHVTPVALGGTDDPGNLVTACRDCNAGKASSAPDATMVADVKELDLLWAGAIKRVATRRSRQRKKVNTYVAAFNHAWHGWRWGSGEGHEMPRPANWQHSIERFYELGVPLDELERLVNVAAGNERIRADDTFRYFCGCVWRFVTEMQDEAKALLESEAPNGT